MNRTDIINYLIDLYKYKSYLEIGAGDGSNYYKIRVQTKIGIEPNSNIKDFIKCTSDKYFDVFENSKFDLIFIDGNHIEEQVTKDINNAINHLTENGIVVLHDCNPPTEKHATEKFIPGTDWNGTVYKAYIKFMYVTDEYDYCTVNTDWGIGIIIPRKLKILKPTIRIKNVDLKEINWIFFEKNRKELLNLISEEQFLQIFSKKNINENNDLIFLLTKISNTLEEIKQLLITK